MFLDPHKALKPLEKEAGMQEQQRLAALHRYEILGSEAEAAFDRIAATAARLFDAPISFVSLVDADRQWFKSCYGYESEGTSREVSFCSRAIESDGVMVVPDATLDPRFVDNPSVTGEPHIRFYAGAPLIVSGGHRLGTLCVIDTKPREGLSTSGRQMLAELAALVVDLLELRLAALEGERAEASLRNTNLLLEVVAGSSVDAIILKDRSGVITSWNPAAQRLYGYSAEEVVGQPISLIIPPDRKGEEFLILDRVLRGEQLESYETQRVNKTGKILDVALSVSPIRQSDGSIAGASTIARDVGVAKRMREDLEKSERRTRSIIDTAHDAYVSIDENSIVREWNKAAEEMFGWTCSEIQDRSLLDTVIPARYRDAHRKGMEHYLATGEGPALNHTLELAALRRDGGEFPIEFTIWPLEGEVDEGRTFHAFIRDITARIETEAALRMGREVAERANSAKSEFLSRMSHELRTPLNAILGFGQLLEMDDLNTEQLENVHEMIRGGKHLLQVINEILDISRIESGRLALSVEAIPLAHAIEETIGLTRLMADESGISLDLPDMTGGLHVLADHQRLKQVLLNLVSNAIKYNRDGGEVAIEVTENDPDSVTVSVRDTGEGIGADKLGRLFSPFDRLGAETSDVEGTGLGLAISKRLVEAMGGTLMVESSVGLGSTFSVKLRRAAAPTLTSVETEAAPQSAVKPASSTVLYVEDNVSNLMLVEQILKNRAGIGLRHTPSGQEALRIAAEERPDLILLDLNLPDMEGTDVFEQLQNDESTSHIPVVIVSADATQAQIKRMIAAGARAYLTKPFDIPHFVKLVEDLLEAGRDERAISRRAG
jgi:protein-histidine pros-kinase